MLLHLAECDLVTDVIEKKLVGGYAVEGTMTAVDPFLLVFLW